MNLLIRIFIGRSVCILTHSVVGLPRLLRSPCDFSDLNSL